MCVYFISYVMKTANGSTTVGNSEVITGNEITHYEDVKMLQEKLERQHGVMWVVITNFILLRKEL